MAPPKEEVVMPTLDAQDLVPEPYPTVAAALWQPERRLMVAVLEDAIHDCLTNAGAPRGLRLARFEDASDWFRSDATDWPFSFVNICDACGFDAGFIRRQLGRCIRVQVLGPSTWGSSSWTERLAIGGKTYMRSWRRSSRVQSLEAGSAVAGA
jgi:hypothetical protein